MGSKEWENNRLQHLVYVTLCSETLSQSSTILEEYKLGFMMVCKPCPNHDARPTPAVSVADTGVRKPLTKAPIDVLTSVAYNNVKFALIRKENGLPLIQAPTLMT